MQCREAMLSFVYRVHEDETAQRCAQLMRDEKIGFVPVVDDRDVVKGVLTDRDLVMAVLAPGRSPLTRAGDLISGQHLLTCRPDDDLREAEAKMAAAKKSRILVVDPHGHPVGVISLSDVAQVEGPAQAGALLREVTHREAVQLVRR